MVKFNTTRAEMDLCIQIAARAHRLWLQVSGGDRILDKLSVAMDLDATHSNGCPLDFEKLLAFPDTDFIHDVAGIMQHIDRTTGKLGDCFTPRCAKPDAEA